MCDLLTIFIRHKDDLRRLSKFAANPFTHFSFFSQASPFQRPPWTLVTVRAIRFHKVYAKQGSWNCLGLSTRIINTILRVIFVDSSTLSPSPNRPLDPFLSSNRYSPSVSYGLLSRQVAFLAFARKSERLTHPTSVSLLPFKWLHEFTIHDVRFMIV